MELFSGGNLKDLIKNSGVLSEIKAAKLMRNVLNGLKFLHSINIMHRDIKPENILFRSEVFDNETQVVLADFGLATYKNEQRYIYSRCGTPGFVAPEIITTNDPDAHYDVKCDLYSVGVTLYYILTANLPYAGKNELIIENRDCLFDFKKSEIFVNLTSDGIL